MTPPAQPDSVVRGYPTRSHPPASAGGVVSARAGSYPVSTDQCSKYDYSISQVYGQSIFTSKGQIYGSAIKKTNSECGKVRNVRVCSSNQDHDLQLRHICCNEPTCPICYPKFSHRLAEGIIERVLGYQDVYPGDPLCHLIMSPPPDTTDFKDMKDAFGQFTKMFMKHGGKAAAVVYHPYRIKQELKIRLLDYQTELAKQNPDKKVPGFWKLVHDNVLGLRSMSDYVFYGPHFHAISTGYLMDSDEFHKKTGWVYKKMADSSGKFYELSIGEITRVAHYECTHAAWEWGKHSVRYVGAISYAKLGREKEGVTREQVKCKVCGAPVHLHAWSDVLESIGDVIETGVQERIILWKYYRRAKRKKKMREDGHQTGPSKSAGSEPLARSGL